jgi:hypothetical protein
MKTGFGTVGLILPISSNKFRTPYPRELIVTLGLRMIGKVSGKKLGLYRKTF